MKDIDTIRRSKKRANGGTLENFSFGSTSDRCNGTSNSSANDKRIRLDARRSNNSAKANMGSSNSKSSSRRAAKTTPSKSTPPTTRSSPTKRGSKQSPKMRPRRRASQTYFFKYQLARNPLKAEEEDLKLALLASLQQCQEQDLKPTSPADETASTPSSPASSSSPSTPTQTDQTATQCSGSATPDTIICKPATPDNILKQYRPETEDFLTFICFRATAPNYQRLCAKNRLFSEQTTSNTEKSNSNASSNNGRQQQLPTATNSSTDGYSSKITSGDAVNSLKQSSNRSTNHFASISSPISNDNHRNQSPSSHRRPTRQSPRLASSINRKISENESSNLTLSTSNTAFELPINYEEDLEKASIALEDMAHEMNSSDGMNCPNNTNNYNKNDDDNNNFAQNSPDCISKFSSSYKNNRHLVKGLMTREFAGAFADEETIFESISNHKL